METSIAELFNHALNNKKRASERYQKIISQIPDEVVRNMIKGIATTETKHEKLIEKMIKTSPKKVVETIQKEVGNIAECAELKGAPVFKQNSPLALKTVVLDSANNAYVSRFYPDKNFHSNRGYLATGGIYRSYIKFNLGSIPKKAKIFKAKLELFVCGNQVSSKYIKVNINRINQDWGEYTITWSKQPSSTRQAYGCCKIFPRYLGKIAFDITDLVQSWHDDNLCNYGILIKADEKNNGFLVFGSAQSCCRKMRPRLTIEYIKN